VINEGTPRRKMLKTLIFVPYTLLRAYMQFTGECDCWFWIGSQINR